MKVSHQITSILLIFLLSGSIFSQLDFLPLNADYTTFAGTRGNTYTEVYLSFYQSDLAYQVEDTMQVAHFTHIIKIIKDDSTIHNIDRHYKNANIDFNQTKGFSQFMDVFPFELSPGKYTLTAYLIDEVSKKRGEYTLNMEIPAYESGLTMSDIQLSTKISKTNKISNYSSKNNLEILPNPSRTFGLSYPILYFYFETYNLKLNKDGNNRYNYHYYLSDTDGRRVRNFPEKIKSSTSKTIAEASGTNIITLASGTYYLNIEIEDIQTGNKTFGRKKFLVDKPSRKSSDDQVTARLEGFEEYMNYTRNELIDEFKKAAYISSSQEEDIFSELDVNGMRRFLSDFWKRRDQDPTTQVNEYKRLYFENIQYANATFSSAFKEGWRTDQGRVLLIYGKPDEIERNPSSINSSPYEIWHFYSLEGGSYFVFADITGHGNHELLHSNYRNEMKDPNWQQRIGSVRTNFGGSSFDNN